MRHDISALPLSLLSVMLKFVLWCRRGDSNPHELPHTPLKRARLPVPPLRQKGEKFSKVAAIIADPRSTMAQLVMPLVIRPVLLVMQPVKLPLPAMDSGLLPVQCLVSTPKSIASRSSRVDQALRRPA